MFHKVIVKSINITILMILICMISLIVGGISFILFFFFHYNITNQTQLLVIIKPSIKINKIIHFFLTLNWIIICSHKFKSRTCHPFTFFNYMNTFFMSHQILYILKGSFTSRNRTWILWSMCFSMFRQLMSTITIPLITLTTIATSFLLIL